MKVLSTTEIHTALEQLKGWQVVNNGLEKEFIFHDFVEASTFLIKVALLSERLNHHPEWSGVYNKLKLRFTTHDLGAVISSKDIEIISLIESYTSNFKP